MPMEFKAQPRLFTDDEIRAGHQHEKKLGRELADIAERKIAPQVEKIHAAAELSRLRLRIAMVPHLKNYDDPRKRITLEMAGKELEHLVDLCMEGNANESQQRIVRRMRLYPDCIASIMEASFDVPSIDRFWRHHFKTHAISDAMELSDVPADMLGRRISEHYAQIQSVDDLRGKGDRGR